ncbi:MAG: hypothetical protein OXT09_24365 [Myxococcales bacterium]|nr:hypothetical protein [Myxococcales bacterium]
MSGRNGPKSYGTFADFEREELRPMYKVGFSIDDLENEANFKVARDEQEKGEPEELDFG